MKATTGFVVLLSVVVFAGVLVGYLGADAEAVGDFAVDKGAMGITVLAQPAPPMTSHGDCIEKGGKNCRPSWFQVIDQMGESTGIAL